MKKGLGVWDLKRELEDLCVKCTSLKPSTAKKYARDLFYKFNDSRDSCINFWTVNEVKILRKERNSLKNALDTLKSGYITSDSLLINIKEISSIKFEDDKVIVRTKDREVSYGKEYEFLKHLF